MYKKMETMFVNQQEVITVKNVLIKLKEMEKGIKYALIVYFILVLADLVSTLMSWELIEYLESNPLYKYGGLPLILILNFLVMYLFYRMYSKSDNPDTRFYILFILVAIITTRIVVVYGNVQLALNPPTLQQVMAIPTEQLAQMKKEGLIEIVAMNLLPLLNGMFTWYLFKKDHEVTRWKKMKKTTTQYLKESLKNLLLALKGQLKN